MTLNRATRISFASEQAVRQADGREVNEVEGALDTTSITGQPIASVTHIGVACTDVSVTHNSLGWSIVATRMARGTTRVLVLVPDVYLDAGNPPGELTGVAVIAASNDDADPVAGQVQTYTTVELTGTASFVVP